MKRILAALVLIGITAFVIYIFPSCNKTKEDSEIKLGKERIVVCYQDKDSATMLIAVRFIVAKSVKKNNAEVDTIWIVNKRLPFVDSLQKPIMDSLGKPLFGFGDVQVSKDSINWQIQGVSVDSLLKGKNNWYKKN